MEPIYTLSRRRFLKAMAITTGAAATGGLLSGCAPANFFHGVASGDPLSDRVIIWTRLTPDYDDNLLVHWEVAKDKHFRRRVAYGSTFTDNTVDYTVKIDVEGLRPDRRYFYRFIYNGAYSPRGTTRTLPVGTTSALSMAVMSCSNYPAGFFNVYREVAHRADSIDFVIHLGDYLYEYDKDGYASEDAEALGRVSVPTHELLTLADYRQRYAQYRSDQDLQAVHRKLPFITVWDDHEIANDTWREGAENHSEDEGDFFIRKTQALQAYYEWIPIRESAPNDKERIFRRFDFGDLCSLHMLDTRVIGRDQQLAYGNYFQADGSFDSERFSAELTDPERSLLGNEQLQWLSAGLTHSTATWQVLGQQVLMAAIALPAPLIFQQISLGDYQGLLVKAQTTPSELTPAELAILNAPAVPLNLDAWDGYPAAREAILQTAKALDKNIISLAGDTHNAWASNLKTLDGQPAGVEFATPSVSSPGLESALAAIDPTSLATALVQFSDQLQYANTEHRGFMVLTLTHTQVDSEWVFIDTIKSPQYTLLDEQAKQLSVFVGEHKLTGESLR